MVTPLVRRRYIASRADTVKKALNKYFGKRGARVVQDNLNCVKRGYKETKEITANIMNA